MTTKRKEPPLLALYENAEGALALAVCGRVAWRCPANARQGTATGQTPRLRLVVPTQPTAAPQGPWQLLSDNQDQIHAVLISTGIFDTLVEHLGAAFGKRRGPMKVWINGAGFVTLKWLIRNYRAPD